MELPPLVARYLQSQFLQQTRPFCFRIDPDYRLKETWGDGSWCGLDSVDVEADMRTPVPFLVGLPLTETQRLEYVETIGRAIVHVHLLPDGDDCFVVMLDARTEHAAVQTPQQSANELKLMSARQRRLIRRQRDLIGELIETRSELDHHRREAQRSSDEKSRYIATMSHEFRTPLASIINYADLAVDPQTTANDMHKCVETISRSARHLTSLIEALLDDARLDAGQLELVEDDFKLHELLADVTDMMAPLAAEKGLSFATQIDPNVPKVVHADGIRLRQILINLLGNAVKYTLDGGVEMKATCNNGRLIVTISDTGPGISLEDQERVFRAFERGRGRAETGAGLGLAITMRLIELMQGELSLDSAPGEGCTISVHVPLASGGQAQDRVAARLPVPGEDTAAAKPVSVLICDDDEDMVALVEHYLHRSGYGLMTSADSSEAVEKALKYAPDLVLMDCNVPGPGGVAAARQLRQRGYAKPIVALTASNLSDEEKSAFTHFFRKPAPMRELLTEIKRLTH
jgi:signal transduction histidine kinase